MWPHSTVAKFISSKKPKEIIKTIMTNWTGSGDDIMNAILTYNSGEFTAQ